jgi:hypothetical protein
MNKKHLKKQNKRIIKKKINNTKYKKTFKKTVAVSVVGAVLSYNKYVKYRDSFVKKVLKFIETQQLLINYY